VGQGLEPTTGFDATTWPRKGYTAGRKVVAERAGEVSIEDEATIAWSEGRYNDARRAWRRLSEDTPALALHRRERIAACLWAQGRLVPAAISLARSQERAAAALRSDDADQVQVGLDWIDTATRLFEHMDRTELRILPKRAARRRILAMVPDDASRLPFHTRSRHQEIRAWLTAGQGSTDATNAVNDVRNGMLEAASLNGYLNYCHRELRDRAKSGKPGSVPREDYLGLQERATKLGALGDAARVVLIPGSEAAFSLWEVTKTVWSVQLGPWQRIRTIGHTAVSRLRR